MATSPVEATLKQCLPDSVSFGTDDQRLEYFKSRALTVEHPRLDQAVDELEWRIRGRIDQDYIMLFGPTGVGKTTAMRLLVNRMNQAAAARSPAAILIEALASEANKFDWRGLYVDILEALSAPFPDSALSVVERSIGQTSLRTVAMESFRANPSVPALKRRVLCTAADRNLQLLALDEAINFLADSNGAKLNSDGEVDAKSTAHIVKSLVNKSHGSILFAGAYDLFDHAFQSGQLARRAEIVHFRRYTESPEDVSAFTQAFMGLLAHFPAAIELDPKDCAADVFEQSIGAVGITRKILQRALVNCVRHKLALTDSVLKSSFFDKVRHRKLKKESEQGESKVQEYLSGLNEDVPEKQDAPVKNTQKETRETSIAPKPFERNQDRGWADKAPSFE